VIGNVVISEVIGDRYLVISHRQCGFNLTESDEGGPVRVKLTIMMDKFYYQYLL